MKKKNTLGNQELFCSMVQKYLISSFQVLFLQPRLKSLFHFQLEFHIAIWGRAIFFLKFLECKLNFPSSSTLLHRSLKEIFRSRLKWADWLAPSLRSCELLINNVGGSWIQVSQKTSVVGRELAFRKREQWSGKILKKYKFVSFQRQLKKGSGNIDAKRQTKK